MNRANKISSQARDFLITVVAMLTLNAVGTGAAQAAPLDLADIPLEVYTGVPPNILLTMDDSGSMMWSYLPDSIEYDDDQVRGAASAFNAMYYNPEVTYTPGVDKDGASLGDSTFTSAWDNGFDQTTCSHDLSDEYQASWDDGDNCDGSNDAGEFMDNAPSGADTGVTGKYNAYYYEFDSTNTDCDGTTDDNDCYDAVILSGSNENFDTAKERPTRSDCKDTPSEDPITCSLAQEQQNFANWFSYYRKRHLLAKTAASAAFARLSHTVRVAYQGINNDYDGNDVRNSTTPSFPLFLPFTGSARSDFFDWLQAIQPDHSTPLRTATVRAGEEFSRSGDDSPYAKEPGVVDTPELECRQNFHFAFTDGYWNGDSPGVGNADDQSDVSLPTNDFGITTYDSQAPYADSNSNSLADVAFEYWVNDLRDTLDDNVPVYDDDRSDYNGDGSVDNTDIFWNPANDPANWQHMVNFTVGLGIDGVLAHNQSTYNELIAGTTDWPATGANNQANVDDLWHAAINSRGSYFSAKKPSDLVSSFTKVLENIEARTGSSSAPAPSAPRFEAGTKLYQPAYNTTDWYGNILAYNVSDLIADPDATPPPVWEARDEINTQDYDTEREILAYNASSGGIAFRYSALSPTQSSLISADQLDYVRGDQSNELSNGGSFRNRNYVLGDVVHSEPRFVPPPELIYPDSLESDPYSTFRSDNDSRTPMLWFGANDGMVHGIDADTGEELLAFVPNTIFPKLADLSSTSYSHQYYVDGSPNHADAYYNSDWHTVLVGGLNGGGQGIYALDITDPSSFDEGNAANLVLWEFNDANDSDLGYTFSKPSVAKMHNGKWVAIFGNGFNNTYADSHVSSSGDAVLYILDLEDGSVEKKISTGVGTAEDPTGTGRPNGLATAEPVDIDGDYLVDYIYAGDLFGNVWKFDVTDSNASNWDVVKVAGTPTPLFVATDRDGDRQPITSGIKVGLHPEQEGVMLNFGTGKYLEAGDISTTQVQSFYGIWDRMESNIHTVQRSHTFEQNVLYTNYDQFGEANARVTSGDTFNFYTASSPALPSNPSSDGYLGWHMDLVTVVEDPPDSGTTVEVVEGERVIEDPERRGSRIIFNTIIPSDNACDSGGSSWLMEINATTGARLAQTPFDYDRDNAFGVSDWVEVPFDVNGDGVVDSNDRVPGSGTQDKDGRLKSAPTVLLTEDGDEVKVQSTADAKLSVIKERGDTEALGRRSWIQLLSD
jgi:type IV pilus assembly protein PilY1